MLGDVKKGICVQISMYIFENTQHAVSIGVLYPWPYPPLLITFFTEYEPINAECSFWP